MFNKTKFESANLAEREHMYECIIQTKTKGLITVKQLDAILDDIDLDKNYTVVAHESLSTVVKTLTLKSDTLCIDDNEKFGIKSIVENIKVIYGDVDAGYTIKNQYVKPTHATVVKPEFDVNKPFCVIKEIRRIYDVKHKSDLSTVHPKLNDTLYFIIIYNPIIINNN